MEKILSHTMADETFFAPAWRVLDDYCRERRDTPQLSDADFLRGGLQRILGQCDSGRDFLQARQDRGETLARSTWFDALHSGRRAAMVAEVATRAYEVFGRSLQSRDWLAKGEKRVRLRILTLTSEAVPADCRACRASCDSNSPGRATT